TPPLHHARGQHQMEVVDPHDRARRRLLAHRLREQPVHSPVRLPRLPREPRAVRRREQRRPERGRREAVIEPPRLLRLQPDPPHLVRLRVSGARDRQPLRERLALLPLRPRDPGPAALLHHAVQRREHAVRLSSQLYPVRGLDLRVRLPVRQHNELTRHGSPPLRSTRSGRAPRGSLPPHGPPPRRPPAAPRPPHAPPARSCPPPPPPTPPRTG